MIALARNAAGSALRASLGVGGRWGPWAALAPAARGARGAASGPEGAGEREGVSPAEEIMSDRYDGHHLPDWASPLQVTAGGPAPPPPPPPPPPLDSRHPPTPAAPRRGRIPQALLRGRGGEPAPSLDRIDAVVKERATAIWRANLRDNLARMPETAGRADEALAAVEEEAARLRGAFLAEQPGWGADPAAAWHLDAACANAAAVRALSAAPWGVPAEEVTDVLAGVNGGYSAGLRARVKGFGLLVARHVFRRDLFWEDVKLLVNLGYGLGPAFAPHVLVPEAPGLGVELQVRRRGGPRLGRRRGGGGGDAGLRDAPGARAVPRSCVLACTAPCSGRARSGARSCSGRRAAGWTRGTSRGASGGGTASRCGRARRRGTRAPCASAGTSRGSRWTGTARTWTRSRCTGRGGWGTDGRPGAVPRGRAPAPTPAPAPRAGGAI